VDPIELTNVLSTLQKSDRGYLQADCFYEGCNDAITTADAGVLRAGYIRKDGVSRGRLLKLEADGRTTWGKIIGPDDSEIFTVDQLSDGDYMFAGRITNYIAWIGRVNSTGNLVAEAKIRIDDAFGKIAPNKIIQTADGASVFVGKWSTTSDLAVSKMWLVKINSTPTSLSPSPKIPELPPEPFPALLVVALIVTVAAVVVAGLFAFKKRKSSMKKRFMVIATAVISVLATVLAFVINQEISLQAYVSTRRNSRR